MTFADKLKTKGVSTFALKIFLFLLIIFLLDLSIGSLLKYLYFQQDSGLLYRTTYSIDSTTAEIVIFGSSTANHHYYPSAFENRMHMSLYNAGRDGNSIFYHYSVLQCMLKRYSPKIAILDFNAREFAKDERSYDRISSLLPYYDSHPEIRPIVDLKSPYEKVKLLSKIYPFNSLLFTIGVGNADMNKNRENINSEEGYIGLKRVWKKQIKTDTADSKYGLDSNKINIFKWFIRDCKNSNIKLYVIISPRFLKYKFEDQSINLAHSIVGEYNVPFFDFSADTSFLNNSSLFADVGHLNYIGAKIYSNKVIDKITEQQAQR